MANRNKKQSNPTIATSMEMDELEARATEQEVKEGDYTQVTKLVIDRAPDEE